MASRERSEAVDSVCVMTTQRDRAQREAPVPKPFATRRAQLIRSVARLPVGCAARAGTVSSPNRTGELAGSPHPAPRRSTVSRVAQNVIMGRPAERALRCIKVTSRSIVPVASPGLAATGLIATASAALPTTLNGVANAWGRRALTGGLAVAACLAWVQAAARHQPDLAGQRLCGDYVAVREALSGPELTSLVDLRARTAMLSRTVRLQPTAGQSAAESEALLDARGRLSDVLRLPNPTARDIWTAARPVGRLCGDAEHWYVNGSAMGRLLRGPG